MQVYDQLDNQDSELQNENMGNFPQQFQKKQINSCEEFRQTGQCQYGDSCTNKFGHKVCNKGGNCPYGEKCKFYHGSQGQDMTQMQKQYSPELNQNSKQFVICQNFKATGYCELNENCPYVINHRSCKFNEQGKPCAKGMNCLYFHPNGDLGVYSASTNSYNQQPIDQMNLMQMEQPMMDMSGGQFGQQYPVGLQQQSKGVCNNFRKSGFCKFGQNCKYQQFHKVCTHFPKGLCSYGDNCKFFHQKSFNQPGQQFDIQGDSRFAVFTNTYNNPPTQKMGRQACDQFRQIGFCQNGDNCFNQQAHKVCDKHLQGQCSFGNNCIFFHPNPQPPLNQRISDEVSLANASNSTEFDVLSKCAVCLTNAKTFVVQPCGHYSYCDACITKISKCIFNCGAIQAKYRL